MSQTVKITKSWIKEIEQVKCTNVQDLITHLYIENIISEIIIIFVIAM